MTSPVLADIYSLDLNGKPNIPALVAAGQPWCGLGFKISEGTYYPSATQAEWLNTYWQQGRTDAGVRYGVDFFRYGYHYFRVGEDPIQQAEKFMQTVWTAGGWGPGDLLPVVDVESSENPPDASPQLVIDGVSSYTERLRQALGCTSILYAGSYIRDLGITDHMGCSYLWTAAYGSTLPAHLYTDMGWPLEELLGWQYQGTDGYSGPKHYPQRCPLGSGPLDLSAITICDGSTPDEQLAWMRDNLLH